MRSPSPIHPLFLKKIMIPQTFQAHDFDNFYSLQEANHVFISILKLCFSRMAMEGIVVIQLGPLAFLCALVTSCLTACDSVIPQTCFLHPISWSMVPRLHNYTKAHGLIALVHFCIFPLTLALSCPVLKQGLPIYGFCCIVPFNR